jgi:hypothetical protein
MLPPALEGEPHTQKERDVASMATSALGHSINDAEVLANYAVRNNITGVQDAIGGIAKAREHFASGNLKGEEQRVFYADYSALASAVSPVTVSSLKDSLDEYGLKVKDWFGLGRKHTLSRAGIVARQKSLIATIVLLALIIFQSYWFIGNSLVLAVQKQSDEELDTLVRLAIFDKRQAQSSQSSDANKAPNETPKPDAKSYVDELAAREKERIQVGRAQQRRLQIARMLAAWGRFQVEPDSHNDSDVEVERIVTISGRILDVLQQYVLPLLYGWLGAMAFVIRSISQQARDRLYRVENETGYDLRIWLGILGGLAIGWFFKTGNESVGSISPLALAFVAGYSADLLFTAMDRIVGSFTTPDKKPEATEPAVRKK